MASSAQLPNESRFRKALISEAASTVATEPAPPPQSRSTERPPARLRQSLRSRLLTKALFRALDSDGDGHLCKAELLEFARHTGFAGNDLEWAEEYRLICEDMGCDLAKGLALESFGSLLDDPCKGWEGKGGHITDDEIRTTLASLSRIVARQPQAGTGTCPGTVVAAGPWASIQNPWSMGAASSTSSTHPSGSSSSPMGNPSTRNESEDSNVVSDTPIWEFKKSEEWKPFLPEDAAMVDRYWSEWRSSPNPQDGGSTIRVTIGRWEYEIDFPKMQQTNLRTWATCPLRRSGRGDVSSSLSDAPLAEIARLRAEVVSLRGQKRLAVEHAVAKEKTARVSLEARVRELEAERIQRLRQDCEREIEIQDSERELESWRQQSMDAAGYSKYSQPKLVPNLQSLLRDLVPHDHQADCARARQILVAGVHRIANMNLWKQYMLKKQQIADAIRTRRACPWATDICPALLRLQAALPNIKLHEGANEVLLLHGTKKAEDIARQGFDDRMNRRALYGAGVYLTSDACKALQYCEGDVQELVVARAVLGHPYLASRDMKTHLRPPEVEGFCVPHDSTIARPGIPNGQGGPKGKQFHWEFVLPGPQLYPEFIVTFKYEA